VQHWKTREFEETMKAMLDEVDAELERRYGETYPLHPARAEAGETTDRAQSGLFTVGALFSPGYGTEVGRGYILDVQIATLRDVPDEIEEEIDGVAASLIQDILPRYFPDRDLSVTREGRYYKIHGDLSLGVV